MKKYYLGELPGRNGQRDKIYYSCNLNEFFAIKKDGEERKLSKKQTRFLYKKYHIKCDLLNIIHSTKTKVVLLYLIGILILYRLLSNLESYSEKYGNLLIEDIPKLEKEYSFDEKILKEERNLQFLINMCKKYIDRNNNYTEEQKEYLKLIWSKYLTDEGELFEREAILEMLNKITSVQIEYKPYENNSVTGRYIEEDNTIILYESYATNATLVHETIHCTIGDELQKKYLDLEEGYCGALCGKYCDEFTYREENEYLLLISEIIGKEKLKSCIINGKEDELIKEIADKTFTEKNEIRNLIVKTYKYKAIPLGKENFLKRTTLFKEIKKDLASLAIKADESNAKNFIVLNAYYDKYTLETSFLEERYHYTIKEEIEGIPEYITIYEENKYDFDDLFEEDYRLQKRKTNE